MVKRSIIIFPEFSNINKVDELRRKFDPLYRLIKPHITVVFPFESDIKRNDLKNHIIEALIGIKSFKILLKGITGTPDGYLFLNVKKGNDEIIEIHDRLYSGILKKFLQREFTYFPHMTIGRIEDKSGLEQALKETEDFNDIFETRVEKIYVEVIDESEKSAIEQIISLNNRNR